MGNISIVIGSWGSYNECNERALGSKWLDLGELTRPEGLEQTLYYLTFCSVVFECLKLVFKISFNNFCILQ